MSRSFVMLQVQVPAWKEVQVKKWKEVPTAVWKKVRFARASAALGNFSVEGESWRVFENWLYRAYEECYNAHYEFSCLFEYNFTAFFSSTSIKMKKKNCAIFVAGAKTSLEGSSDTLLGEEKSFSLEKSVETRVEGAQETCLERGSSG